jgi:hypothetical protein
MSNDGTLGQARHILTLVEQQQLSPDNFKTLFDGYLTDLCRAIKLGVIQPREAFQKQLGLCPTQPEFDRWRTVNLGVGENYSKALYTLYYRVPLLTRLIIESIPVSSTEVELDLVLVTLKQLGFIGAARYRDIRARAIKLGLQLCPAEVGPALRLSCTNTKPIMIGMSPMKSGGKSYLFEIGSAENEWLESVEHFGTRLYPLGSFWVFVKPRPHPTLLMSGTTQAPQC